MELEATRDDILFEVHQLRNLSDETGEYFEHEVSTLELSTSSRVIGFGFSVGCKL